MYKFGLIMVVLLTAGCMTSPPHREVDTSIALPQVWDGAAHRDQTSMDAPSTRWWQDFHSGELSQSIERMLEQNASLKAADAALRSAGERVNMRRADLLPQVSAGLDGSRQKQNFIGLPLGDDKVFSATYSQFSAAISTSWEADLWGRLSAGTKAAVAEYEAVGFDAAALRLSLTGQTAKLWLDALEAHHQVALAQEMQARFQEEVDQVERRFEQGILAAIDLRLARVKLADTEALLGARLQERDEAARRLRFLMGDYPSASPLAQVAFPSLPDTIPAGLPADLVGRRPDLAAAERRLAAGDQNLLAAQRALYPRLTLTGSLGLASNDFGDLLKGDFSLWSLAAGLAQPIFQGGHLRANIRAVAADNDRLAHQFVDKALLAYTEVEMALGNEQRLQARLSALEEARSQSAAAAERAQKQYFEGLISYLNVLEAQRGELQARGQVISLKTHLLKNRIDLYLALGGGFQAADSVFSVSDGRN